MIWLLLQEVIIPIGTLNIIDGDRIELTNLHRQHMYSLSDIGKKKVKIAKRVLRKFSED